MIAVMLEVTAVYRVVSLSGIFIATGLVVLLVVTLIQTMDRIRELELARQREARESLDYLTGLPMRHKGEALILEKMQKQGGCLGFVDMDNLKKINDVYGHNEGDAVLKEMAVRAGTLVDDVFEVYRLAGDEFVAIVASGQTEVIDTYAMKILDTFKIPYQIAGGEQYLASSIGIAIYPKDGKNSTEVIAAADHAMYEVKKNGKNSRAFYDAGMKKDDP